MSEPFTIQKETSLAVEATKSVEKRGIDLDRAAKNNIHLKGERNVC